MPTRREVLKWSAGGAATLLLGVRPVWAQKGDAAFAPGVWLRIERSGKTIVTIGKSEMGQGVRTALPMILAGELDADWEKIEVRQASPGPDFKRLGTGGSQSVRSSWPALRLAGAAAREMLVAAAASRWGVDAASCRTEKGEVVHAASGRRLEYGALVAAAAKLPVPANPKLKPVAEMALVGKAHKRIDGPAIVSGEARYGIDVRLPGMLHASIERAPVVGGKPRRVDDGAARAVAGVRRVVTLANGGVAVVADSTFAAMAGRKALKIDWDEGANASFNSADHWKRLETAAAEPGVVTRREGGAPPAGGKEVRARYHYGFAAHAAVEPMNCVASVAGGRCEIWAPTQVPNHVKGAAIEALGLAPDKVTVNVTLLGGGFGRRLNTDFIVEALELAKQVERPVQVLWTRADDMRHGHFQAACIHEMWGQVDGGRGVAWRHKKISSPHNLRPPDEEDRAAEKTDPGGYYAGMSWGVYDVPYTFPAIETSYVKVEVPVPIGPWRAVFSPSSTFARECFMDELAAAAGADPLAFRLKMLEGPDRFSTHELEVDRSRLRNVLRLVGEKSGWGQPLPAGRFRGLACNVYDGDTHVAYVAEVSVRERPAAGQLPFVVHRVVAVVDCGVVVNPLGVAQQVESGVVWGLSNMKSEITFAGGRAEQSSYGDFDVLRMSETPVVETHLVPSHGEEPMGIGEPTVPPIVPAVANALAAATGKRLRRLPATSATY